MHHIVTIATVANHSTAIEMIYLDFKRHLTLPHQRLIQFFKFSLFGIYVGLDKE